MKPRFLLTILALFLTIVPIGLTTGGCASTGAPTAEQVSYKTIKATDDAVLTALKVWANRYVAREKANDATKQSDPGGYLDRRNALIQEDGKVRQLQAEYTSAVSLVVDAWVKAKRAGTNSTAEPIPDAAVTKAADAILSIAK